MKEWRGRERKREKEREREREREHQRLCFNYLSHTYLITIFTQCLTYSVFVVVFCGFLNHAFYGLF